MCLYHIFVGKASAGEGGGSGRQKGISEKVKLYFHKLLLNATLLNEMKLLHKKNIKLTATKTIIIHSNMLAKSIKKRNISPRFFFVVVVAVE